MLDPEALADENYVTVPRGGPIYISDMVGPLTKVADFEVSIFHELERLKAELSSDSLEMFDDEISIEDLKIICEEELVAQAFEEAFKDDELGILNNKGPDKSKTNKRKRKKNTVDEHYILKVEQLAKVKEKQEEEKAAARLHSFNGSCSSSHSAPTSSSKSGRMISLKSGSLGTKTQEFLVLGRQFLTEMRDKIYCITDEIMKKTGKNDPSGFFLVEDVFCNDFRHPSATDYSKPILDWLQDSRSEAVEKWESIASGELPQKQKALFGSKIGPQLPHFKTIQMQKTRFCDLWFRLGAGYLYCHQGDCKHLVVIRDMRMIHPEDVQNRAAYPLITFQPKLRFQKCSVCKIFKAVKVTVDDKWAAENPCYFCELCYYMLHYVDGSLLYDDFSVYEYLHE
ncbi:snRNA-activating protein complex subunit isoform X2 [Solanum lycopersicum]|uniref:snRNA-activating protein complex subunit isoform X2 n=1 Tax=Solanum lycopersicum TaxID=4081 RepID=UPI000532ABE0|nr:snRNA-activating protein complex subunit isoform X2 [Solanum lycopersicum]